MTRPVRRLYCAGTRKDFKYIIASNKAEASQLLGMECRVPDPDDIRHFWKVSRISEMSAKERHAKFGISRQAANYMRRRGGDDLPHLRDVERKRRRDRIANILTQFPGIRFKEVLKLSKSSAGTIKRVAREMGYHFTVGRRIPDDQTLIELATGRTWREFAKVVGLRLATLRHYIYKRPELTAALRKVRKAQPTGAAARGKINLLKVKQLGQQGMSAYSIAELLNCEQMAVRFHLLRWGKEFPHEFPPPYGNKRKTVRTVARRDGGSTDQPG